MITAMLYGGPADRQTWASQDSLLVFETPERFRPWDLKPDEVVTVARVVYRLKWLVVPSVSKKPQPLFVCEDTDPAAALDELNAVLGLCALAGVPVGAAGTAGPQPSGPSILH